MSFSFAWFLRNALAHFFKCNTNVPLGLKVNLIILCWSGFTHKTPWLNIEYANFYNFKQTSYWTKVWSMWTATWLVGWSMSHFIFIFYFFEIQTAMKALGRTTKESSQGRDQTCSVLLGEPTATGQPSGSLLLSNLIHVLNPSYDVHNRPAS